MPPPEESICERTEWGLTCHHWLWRQRTISWAKERRRLLEARKDKKKKIRFSFVASREEHKVANTLILVNPCGICDLQNCKIKKCYKATKLVLIYNSSHRKLIQMVNILKRSQGNLEKEQSWRTHNSQFYNRVQSCRNQNSVDKDRHKIMESNWESRNKPSYSQSTDFQPGYLDNSVGKRMVFSTGGAGKLDILDIHRQKIYVDK